MSETPSQVHCQQTVHQKDRGKGQANKRRQATAQGGGGVRSCVPALRRDAARIPDGEVGPYRLDPVLAYHNVQAGLTALQPHRDEL